MSNDDTPIELSELPVTECINILTASFSNDNLYDVNDETDFKRIKQNSWKEHSQQYTELLTNYVENSKKTLESKQSQKKWFFIIAMVILLITIISSAVVIYKVSTGNAESIDKIIVVIPSLLTFFTPLFVIPNLIAKYLFNTQDEKHMIEVVKHIISHDDNSVNKS